MKRLWWDNWDGLTLHCTTSQKLQDQPEPLLTACSSKQGWRQSLRKVVLKGREKQHVWRGHFSLDLSLKQAHSCSQVVARCEPAAAASERRLVPHKATAIDFNYASPPAAEL